jgi:hypothetical protein
MATTPISASLRRNPMFFKNYGIAAGIKIISARYWMENLGYLLIVYLS